MTENDRVTQLTRRQAKFVEALLAGANLTVAAKTAGIGYSTAQRWQLLPVVTEMLRMSRKELFEASLDELKRLMSKALETLEKHMDAEIEPTAATQLQAAKGLLEQAIVTHKVDEVRAELLELRRRLDDAGK